MSDDNLFDLNERINKKDLQLILEVNKKSILLEQETANQNEDIIELLNELIDKDKISDEKLDKIIEQNEDLSKDIFKLQVFFSAGLISLVLQVIQLFIKK